MDQYAYTASSTSLTTMLPDWVLEQGGEKARETHQSEESLKRVLADMKKSNEGARRRTDMSYAVISSCGAYPQYVGRNIMQAAQYMKLAQQSGGKELLAPDNKVDDTKLPPVTMDEQYRAVIDIYLHG